MDIDSKNKTEKILLIVATNFPYINGEPYLEDELKIISKKIPKIIIALPEGFKNKNLQLQNNVPPNTEVKLFDSVLKGNEKIKALLSLFNFKVFKELFYLKSFVKANYSLLTIKTMMDAFLRAKKFRNNLESFLIINNLLHQELVLVSYWCTEYTVALIEISRKYPNIKVHSRLHAWDIYLERNYGNYLPFRKYIFDNINKCFVISQHGINYINNHYIAINKDKLILMPLGVLPGNFSVSLKKKNSLKILTLAFISKVKRMERIIEALALVDERFEIEWIHIGDGNKDYYSFEKMAFELLSKKTNIKFSLLGKKSKEEVYEYLNNEYFDLLVNCSDTEGLPVSMMECMARGIPVLAPRLGGIPEIVEHKINGYLLSIDTNSKEIKAAIEDFINLEKSEYEIYRKNAFNTWQTKFNAKKNYSKSLYEFFN